MKINHPVTDNEVHLQENHLLVSKTDLKGIITFANPDFVEISGFTEAELIGKNHNMVRHPDMPPAAFQDLWDTVQKGRPWTGIVKNRCKNGDYYWVNANVTPLRENGRVIEYISVRTRPTREQVQQAETLYHQMNQGKMPKEPLLQRLNLFRRMPLIYKLGAATGLMTLVIIGLLAQLTLQADTPSDLLPTYLLTALCVGLATIAGLTTVFSLQSAVKQMSEEFIHLSQDNYKREIDVRRFGEVGTLLRGLKSMQIKLGFDVNDARQRANEMQRIKVALDNVSTSVMVADVRRNIIYMNKTVKEMMKNAEADIRQQFPNFSADAILGMNIDAFHNNPEHQKALLAQLNETHKARIKLGGRTFDLTVNPVVDASGERLGNAVEWNDVTEQIGVEREIDEVVNAVSEGELNRRIALEGKTGFIQSLSQGVNEMTRVVDESLSEVEEVLSALSNGDLSQRVSTGYQGAFGRLADSTNKTIDQLRTTVSKILASGNSISSASTEIAQGNTDLSQRTEEQASSLEETASSMEQLTSTVRQNADNARQANQLASNAREQAERGGQVVGTAVDAMAGINQSSKKIADIIGVIDEIAFQTNLLALNAAVEAARAGEQGRGFAVVASEVRNLAQRSATAAKEIKELITDSVNKVEEGSQLVNDSGKTLDEIVNSVKKVSDIVAEIAAASQEQSQGIDQVNKAVMQMDEMTQQNAALVEEAAAASESLDEQAQELSRLISFFSTEGSGDNLRRKVATEFAAMRRAHLAWKNRLIQFLNGDASLTEQEVVSHKDCKLGHWLYDEGGLSRFSHFPDMKEMEETHAKMHETIKLVVRFYHEGNYSDADREFQNVVDMSTRVVSLLERLSIEVQNSEAYNGPGNTD